MNLSYLIWNGNPEIFTYGWLSLRWYGLLFALGFLLSQQILYYMFKRDKLPQSDVDTLTIYMVIATILGARLGHIIFYQPEIIWEDPLGILLPFEFTPEFRFTGLQGLASHGAAFGILFALWVYSNYLITFSGVSAQTEAKKKKEESEKNRTSAKKGGSVTETVLFGTGLREFPADDPDGNAHIKNRIKDGFNFIKRIKPGQSYIQTLDRIVILVTLTGALIRLGNFFNSEIIGKPTDGPTGVVFITNVTEALKRAPDSMVESIEVTKDEARPDGANGRRPINIWLFFKNGTTEEAASTFLLYDVKRYLLRDKEFIDESPESPLDYTIATSSDGVLSARIHTMAIARHPSQLYESISCFFFFLILFWLWTKRKVDEQPGFIFGVFMIVLWSLRFAYEFIKEPQVDFENTLPINMGQILSIPLIIAGVIILVRAISGKFKESAA